MSFAIIETGGKQYKVSASNILKVEKLNIPKGKKVEFKKVLLVNDDKTTEVGSPTISGAIVEGFLLDNIRDKYCFNQGCSDDLFAEILVEKFSKILK